MTLAQARPLPISFPIKFVSGLAATFCFCIPAAMFAQTTSPADARPGQKPASAESISSAAAPGDKAFVEKAAMGGMAEVELGKLAAEKGTDDAVRRFGQHMVDDHTKANDGLKAAAMTEGIRVPSELDAAHRKQIDKLKSLSGAQFDAAYKKLMLEDHRKDVALFEKEAASGKSAVDQFAATTLPTLKDHLQMIEELNGKSTAKR